ncbi:MAG: MscL family protein [Candidatus Aenigmatarchaeota archaeon]
MTDLTQDFLRFLKEYGIVSLAIAVVIGTAAKDLVNATVDDVIMPFVNLFLPGGNWQNATFSVGEATFKIGHLLSVIIEFVIIALLVYLFVRYILKKEKVEKV